MSDYPQRMVQQDLDEENQIAIADYLSILLDEWRLLIVPFVLVLLGTIGYLVVVVPMYSAMGVIQVSTSDSTDAEAILNIAGGKPSQVNTEMEICALGDVHTSKPVRIKKGPSMGIGKEIFPIAT